MARIEAFFKFIIKNNLFGCNIPYLQVYLKYKSMAINFLRNQQPKTQVYQNRTVLVSKMNYKRGNFCVLINCKSLISAFWHVFDSSLIRIFRIFSCVGLPVSLYREIFSKFLFMGPGPEQKQIKISLSWTESFPKKEWSTKRLLTIGGIAALVLLIAASFYFTSGKSKLNVELERITVSDITKGTFQESIPQNGTVMPLTTIYLPHHRRRTGRRTICGGRRHPEKRRPHPSAVESRRGVEYCQQYYEYFPAAFQYPAGPGQCRPEYRQQTAADGRCPKPFIEAERIYNLDKRLYAQKAIGSQEYQQAVNNYNYYNEKRRLQLEILHQDTVSRQQANSPGYPVAGEGDRHPEYPEEQRRWSDRPRPPATAS